jgi:hypothetical protein
MVYIPIVPQLNHLKKGKKELVDCCDIKIVSKNLDLTKDIAEQIKYILRNDGLFKKFIDYSITPISEKEAILVMFLKKD